MNLATPISRLPLQRTASLLLLTLVIGFGGKATFLSAKAAVAQVLLTAAWDRAQATDLPVRPWPWADTAPAGLLEVPRLGIRQVVLDGHSGEALAFGPGLVSVSGSHVVGGHRDSHLAYLKNLFAGELLTFTLPGQSPRHYRVSAVAVLDTRHYPDYSPPPDSLTLITCYPFDALRAGGPLRYVVVAELL